MGIFLDEFFKELPLAIIKTLLTPKQVIAFDSARRIVDTMCDVCPEGTLGATKLIDLDDICRFKQLSVPKSVQQVWLQILRQHSGEVFIAGSMVGWLNALSESQDKAPNDLNLEIIQESGTKPEHILAELNNATKHLGWASVFEDVGTVQEHSFFNVKLIWGDKFPLANIGGISVQHIAERQALLAMSIFGMSNEDSSFWNAYNKRLQLFSGETKQ